MPDDRLNLPFTGLATVAGGSCRKYLAMRVDEGRATMAAT